MLRLPLVRARGFTLVELTIVLVIISLLLGMLMGVTTGFLEAQRAEATRTKMRVIDAALVSYVALNKRLPCPADGAVASGAANAGAEMGGGGTGNPCTLNGSSQSMGVVPWVALGLSASDAEDGWGVRFTYRLDYALARDNAMDMSGCDPAGTGTVSALGTPPVNSCVALAGSPCISSDLGRCVRPSLFLTDKGIRINDGAGNPLMDPSPGGVVVPTGAAYVLISHGENRAGGINPSGIVMESNVGIEGSGETSNRADGSYVRLTTVYVDVPQNFSLSNARFDDFISRPSIMTVIQGAHLGPRSH